MNVTTELELYGIPAPEPCPSQTCSVLELPGCKVTGPVQLRPNFSAWFECRCGYRSPLAFGSSERDAVFLAKLLHDKIPRTAAVEVSVRLPLRNGHYLVVYQDLTIGIELFSFANGGFNSANVAYWYDKLPEPADNLDR